VPDSTTNSDIGLPDKIDSSNIDQVEMLVLERVSQTITALGGAVAIWEGSKEKSPVLAKSFERHKYFLTALEEWEAGTLKMRSKKAPVIDRITNLQNFVVFCYQAR
jgi:hypothetical protein